MVRNRISIQNHRKLLPSLDIDGVTYPRPGLQVRRDLLTVLLTGVAWVIAISIVASVVQSSRPIARDESGSVTEENDANWSEVKVGDCVTSAETDVVATSLTVIPCSQNHHWQIYGIGDSVLTTFSEANLETEANSICDDYYPNISMDKLHELPFEVEDLYYMPTASSWSKGDRTITCLLGSTANFVPESVVK